ncbi:a-g-specific adenine DNA glycosylase related protein, putative [Babesia caballi]|uniref:A-g-specific adenine DNA glycosylase related protein, putative n=1 Tax=Babesia caballi TaxID=5871 RepID=A0AAV4LQZ0_BABCB|nr:a-g-specific adenine DNA glycosylase related protein, putative [Babesia caballi]
MLKSIGTNTGSMDVAFSIAGVNRALDVVVGILRSHERIDEHMSELRLREAARVLGSCYSDTVSLSRDGDLEEDINLCCASLRAKCLAEIAQLPPSASDDYVRVELERYSFRRRFEEPSSGTADAVDCGALFQGLVEDANVDDTALSEEAERLMHSLKWEWYRRYEMLVKLTLFFGRRWLSFSAEALGDGDYQAVELHGKERRLSYCEFEDCVLLLNLSDAYLRLIEQCAFGYVAPKVHAAVGYDADEAGSVDYIYEKYLRLKPQRGKAASAEIDGHDSASQMVLDSVGRIGQVKGVLQRLLRLSANGTADAEGSSSVVEAHIEYSTVDLTSFKCLSPLYQRVLVDDLVSRLVESSYASWESECAVGGVLRGFRALCDAVQGNGLVEVNSSSRFVARFFQCILNSYEKHVLVFARFCVRSQSDEDMPHGEAVKAPGVMRGLSVRQVDKRVLTTALGEVLGQQFQEGALSEVVNAIDWVNQIEQCNVSNHVFTLCVLMFVMSAQPIALLRDGFDVLGPDVIPQLAVDHCVEQVAALISSVVTTYLTITQDAFKQFVLSVTKTVSKDEDARELSALKTPLVMFMLLLSNVSLISGCCLAVPFFVQALEARVSGEEGAAARALVTAGVADLVKRHFHVSGAQVQLLKVQDYLVAQLAAFVQQVLQKLLSRVLNALNDETRGFGEEALQLFALISSLSESVLPRKLHVTTLCLVIDLYFTTVPDVFLDYLDLMNYQPSGVTIGVVTAFIVRLEGALSGCVLDIGKDRDDLVYYDKFTAFAGVFRHDYSVPQPGQEAGEVRDAVQLRPPEGKEVLREGRANQLQHPPPLRAAAEAQVAGANGAHQAVDGRRGAATALLGGLAPDVAVQRGLDVAALRLLPGPVGEGEQGPHGSVQQLEECGAGVGQQEGGEGRPGVFGAYPVHNVLDQTAGGPTRLADPVDHRLGHAVEVRRQPVRVGEVVHVADVVCDGAGGEIEGDHARGPEEPDGLGAQRPQRPDVVQHVQQPVVQEQTRQHPVVLPPDEHLDGVEVAAGPDGPTAGPPVEGVGEADELDQVGERVPAKRDEAAEP